MSKGAVLASLVVAVVLAGAAYLLLGQGNVGPDQAALISHDPAGVAKLEFDLPGQPTRAAVPDGTGGWELVTMREGVEIERWPLVLEHVQGAVRLLTTMEGDEASGDGFEPAGTIRLYDRSGASWTIQFAGERLSGRRVVRIESPDGGATWHRVDSGLIDALIETDPSAWRDARLLAGLSQPDRIVLDSGGEKVTFTRVGERWRVVEADATADADAVQQLMQSLSSLSATRFVGEARDESESAGLGLISVTSSRRSMIEGEMRTVTTRADIRLGAANLSLDAIEVEVVRWREGDGQAAGPWTTRAMVPRQRLESIRRGVTAYLSKRTIAVGEGEVGGIDVAVGVRLRRTLDGWRIEDGRSLTSTESAAVLDLIRTLGSPAAGVTLSDEIIDAGTELTIVSIGGAPLERLRVAVRASPAGDYVVTRVGRVVREYSPGAGVVAFETIRSIRPTP